MSAPPIDDARDASLPDAVATLLRPRSIAIVGASDRSRWSASVLANLTEHDFPGEVQLVNPRSRLVHGRITAPSAAALDTVPDLGVVMVPDHAVVEAVADLGQAGVASALVLTSGFAETGPAGQRLQQELVETARSSGIRLLGPNSLGFLNFVDGARVWATPVAAPSRSTGIGIVSQSGATAYFLTSLAHQQDVGLSHVVATGNEADVDVAAVADHLLDEPHCRAVAMFVETVRHPARFVEVARRALDAAKPLVVLKVGSSEATARSALAHTGALVGDDRVFDGICEQYGIIRVTSLEDLVATADIIGRTGELRPGGLGVVSNSGGICEIAADAASARGIALPAATPHTRDEAADALPGYGTLHNPLDLTGGIEPAQSGRLVAALGAQPDVSAMLVPFYPVPTVPEERSERLTDMHHHLSAALRRSPVPGMLVSYQNTTISALSREIIAEHDIPYLACGLDRAVGGLAKAFWWSDRLRATECRPAADVVAPPVTDERPRSERETLDFLGRHGVPVVPSALVATEAAAVTEAAAMGGPVVLKIASPDIGHKSEIGGVALDVRGEDAVREAFRTVLAAGQSQPGARIDGVLVSPMRRGGVELFVGCSRDPQWGPVLVVGLGGIWVEVLADAALRRLPVGTGEIRAMLAQLRGARLLAGERGLPPADLATVAAAVERIGAAALGLGPELEALDVNPLWVRGDHVEAVDALMVWRSS